MDSCRVFCAVGFGLKVLGLRVWNIWVFSGFDVEGKPRSLGLSGGGYGRSAKADELADRVVDEGRCAHVREGDRRVHGLPSHAASWE